MCDLVNMATDGEATKRQRLELEEGQDEPDVALLVAERDSSSLSHAHKIKKKQVSGLSSQPSTSSHSTQKLSYEELEEVARVIQRKTAFRPKIGIICGSGLGGLAESLDQDPPKDVISYKDIPRFPQTTVKGHKGNLVFGHIKGCPVVCMQGRFHFYEGHHPTTITMPVRVMKLLGVDTLVVTNAAGGLNSDYNRGDLMIVKDHVNLAGMTGANPLIGDNEDKFGPRFPAMTTAYDGDLRQLAKDTARELNMSGFTREGVYVHLSGPSYETPAESQFLKLIGADAVGMSTAPEVVVAKHCGMKVLGISLVTNMVILEHDSTDEPPNHKEVMETADRRAKDMQTLVKTVIGKLHGNTGSKL